MLESGTPILKALKSLARRGETKGARDLVSGIADYVEAGNPLWQAFAREPKHFSPVFVNLVKAAEASGTLPRVLERLADNREQRERLRRFMQVALIYPSILVTVSLVLVIILSMFVIPAFREIFETMDAELNWYSVFIMDSADWIARWWWLLVLLIVGAIIGYQAWVRRSPVARLRADQFWLKVPIAGGIIRKRSVAEFMRTFSMLQRSGISMMATLDLCKNSVGNHAYIGVIQDMRDSVEAGEGLEAPLREAEKNGYMPGVVVDMLLTGEETGSMEQVADQIADTYEEEVEIAVNGMKEAITPVFVVLMGFIVGGIVIGMFLPLISMIQTISSGSM
jgi:type IV pilus assembly protein PilC